MSAKQRRVDVRAPLGAIAQDGHVDDLEEVAGRREKRDGALRADIDADDGAGHDRSSSNAASAAAIYASSKAVLAMPASIMASIRPCAAKCGAMVAIPLGVATTRTSSLNGPADEPLVVERPPGASGKAEA